MRKRRDIFLNSLPSNKVMSIFSVSQPTVNYSTIGDQIYGEVREWLNRTVSKTVVRVSVPWVRIPPSPPCIPDSAVNCKLSALKPATRGL
jgi:hypothetical protein